MTARAWRQRRGIRRFGTNEPDGSGTGPPQGRMFGVLRPWTPDLRFESGEAAGQFLKSPYPLVRWTDRWGARWEHRLGEVRQIRDDQDWAP